MDNFYKKYLKYKQKYIDLKENIGGSRKSHDIDLQLYTQEYKVQNITQLKNLESLDIISPVIVFDFGGVLQFIDENCDLGIDAICISYIDYTRRRSQNYHHASSSIQERLNNKQLKLGIIVGTDRSKGIIIDQLGLNRSNVHFIDDGDRNIREVRDNANNVVCHHFISKPGNEKTDLINKINEIKALYGLPPINNNPIISEVVSKSLIPIIQGPEEYIREKNHIPTITLLHGNLRKALTDDQYDNLGDNLFTKLSIFLLENKKIPEHIKERYLMYYANYKRFLGEQFYAFTGIYDSDNSKFISDSLAFYNFITFQDEGRFRKVDKQLLFNPNN